MSPPPSHKHKRTALASIGSKSKLLPIHHAQERGILKKTTIGISQLFQVEIASMLAPPSKEQAVPCVTSESIRDPLVGVRFDRAQPASWAKPEEGANSKSTEGPSIPRGKSGGCGEGRMKLRFANRFWRTCDENTQSPFRHYSAHP